MKDVKDAESLAIDILTFLTGISSRDGEKFPVLRKAVRTVSQNQNHEGISVRTAAGQPAAIVPRESLIDRHRTVRQLADVCGCAHVQPFAVVRVAAGVLAKPSIIWLNVALQIRVIRPRAVYLYPD